MLGRVEKYSCTIRVFQPMMPTIPSENTIATLCQLHPLPSNHVPQHEHTFVMDRTLFAHALTIAPHLTLGGLSGMAYEHLSKCSILEDTSSNYFKLLLLLPMGSLGRWP
jgi:hypothetical protein